MSQFPPPIAGGAQQPHRGVLILVLGILGIVLCVICGVVAWVMGNADLKAMAEGRMDRTGEGMTKAGKICGMVGVALWAIWIVVWVLMMVIGIGAGVAGAAGARP